MTQSQLDNLKLGRVAGIKRPLLSAKKKGCIAWNKGTKGVMKPNSTSFKKGTLQGVQFEKGLVPHNKGVRKSTNTFLNENINAYKALHKRIGRKFKKTGICENCSEEKKTQWANKDNQYLEVRDNWLELCSLCHVRYDQSKL